MLSVLSYPSGALKFIMPDSSSIFKHGMVGQLYPDGLENFVLGVSNGSNPCGIINDTPIPLKPNRTRGTVEVYDFLVGATDFYDKNCVFKPGDMLCSNSFGELTNTFHVTNPVIGQVINYDLFLNFVYFGPSNIQTTSITNTAFVGKTCCLCKMVNEYAVANQLDGSYKCYECRR